MQAFEIAYDESETHMALGWPSGMLRIHPVQPDGSPGEPTVEVLHHRATVVHVSFAGDRVVSVCEDGKWALSDASSGDVIRSGEIDGGYLAADVDPTGSTLFVFRYQRKAEVVAISLASGEQIDGPDVNDPLSVKSRVFALDEQRAAFHVCNEDYQTDEVVDGLVFVDFGAGTAKLRTFDNAPVSDFNDDRFVMDIDATAGRGIRKSYDAVQRVTKGDLDCYAIALEVFAVDGLAVQQHIDVLFFPVDAMGDEVTAAMALEPTEEAYRKTRDEMLDQITAMKLAGDVAWIGMKHGRVRRVDLTTGETSVFVLHGGAPKQGGFTLNDVFARNMINAYTLGVSPSGRRVAFSNPNDFFDAEHIGLDASEAHVKLPNRYADAEAVEAPAFCGLTEDGSLLIVAAASEDVFAIDPTTGEVVGHHHIEFPYGDVTGAAKSPDGHWLVLSVSGGSPFLWNLESNEAGFVEVPPHTTTPRFVADRLVVMGHHGGAVVGLDIDAFLEVAMAEEPPEDEGFSITGPGVFCYRQLASDDDDEPPGDDPFEAFEQSLPEYTRFAVGDHLMACSDDDGDVTVYSVGGDAFEVVALHDGPFKMPYRGLSTIVMAGDRLVGPAGEGKLVAIDPKSGKKIASIDASGVTRLVRTTDGLLGFRDGTGELVRLDPAGDQPPQLLFACGGAAVGAVSVGGQRACWVEADGTIVLAGLDGQVTHRLLMRPGTEARSIEMAEA